MLTLVKPPDNNLVKSVLGNQTRRPQVNTMFNKPFSEDEVLKVFCDNNFSKINYDLEKNKKKCHEYSLTTKLLMLYYVLLYEEHILQNMKKLISMRRRPKRHSASVINKIPIKFLLHKAQHQPESCQGLYPALIGLLVNHLPHLCMVHDQLVYMDLSKPTLNKKITHSKKILNVKLTPEVLYKNMCNSRNFPAPLLLNMRSLMSCFDDDVIRYVKAFAWGLPKLLQGKVARRLKKEAAKLWLRLNSLVPRKLWVLTINAFLADSSAWNNDMLPLSGYRFAVDFDKMVDDPILILGVDKRVLQCSEFLELLLRIMSACIAAYKANMNMVVKALPSFVCTDNISFTSKAVKSKVNILI